MNAYARPPNLWDMRIYICNESINGDFGLADEPRSDRQTMRESTIKGHRRLMQQQEAEFAITGISRCEKTLLQNALCIGDSQARGRRTVS
ncbi:hypothetical protein COOONC_00626 [Cooperia oncophora]